MAKRRGGYVQLMTPEGVQRWRIAFRVMKDYGEVDWNTRTIWLREGQSNDELADTVCHEAGHVATGLGSEDTIERALSNMAAGSVAILKKLKLIVEEDD